MKKSGKKFKRELLIRKKDVLLRRFLLKISTVEKQSGLGFINFGFWFLKIPALFFRWDFLVLCIRYYPCIGFSRSLTVFTGLKVSIGTSTNTVIQSAIAPFHSPGSSKARNSRPSFDLLETKPVAGST